MFQHRRWVEGLVAFTIVAPSVGLVIRRTGSEERLPVLPEHPWWDWVPWILLILFWVVIVRAVRKRGSGG